MPEDIKIPKWEYKKKCFSEEELNQLGQKGWEVCGVEPGYGGTIVKRQAGWIRVTEHVHEAELNNEYQQDTGYSR